MTVAAPPEPAAPLPPSLDRGSRNPQGRGSRTGEQTRITNGAQRRHLIAIATDRHAALELAGCADGKLGELWRRLRDGWAGCGWSALYRNRLADTVVGLPDHCDKPLCPYDEQRRAGRLRDRYRAKHDAALEGRRLYFAVLTMPNVPPGEPAAAFDRIRVAIGKLRRRRWFADGVAGGLWRLEVTVNLETGTWHPHANLLFETHEPIRMATWQPLLQAEWRSVLGESDQQWVWLYPGWAGTLPETIKRQVKLARPSADDVTDRDGATSIDYTVKAPKPDWIDAADAGWVIEYVETQRGRRSVSAFASWRGAKAPKIDDPADDLVEAPWTPGDDPHTKRRLPLYDPTLPAGTVAQWEFVGRGPRWPLRPVRAPGARREWLVWRPGDEAPDPGRVDDDTALVYQPALLPRAGP